jgi:hypothetical protein
MNLPPKSACPECKSLNAKIEEIMAALDLSVPEMDAAVAARDKAWAIFFRDEVREQMTDALPTLHIWKSTSQFRTDPLSELGGAA